jgi:uncharacterized protein (DUF58 family)
MSPTWFLGLIVFAVLVSALLSLNGGQLALVVPILVYWAYALVRAPANVTIRGTRTLTSNQVSAGESVEVNVEIKNEGAFLEELVLEDALPSGLELVKGGRRHILSLGRNARFSFSYSIRGQRGGYTFDGILAEAGDTLGMLRFSTNIPAPARLQVMPTVNRIAAIPIRPRRTRVYSGVIPARVGGAGVEFFGVRPYSNGDSARRINWRLLARHPQSLYCNEFQQERIADVAVVLDGRERANLQGRHGALFEHCVLAAGSLASAFLQQGNRVGLLVYSHYLQWTFPGYGKVQRQRILQALAVATPGASQVFEGLQYLPTRLFPVESQIIFISPVLEADPKTIIQLRARGYQVTVIAPDPVAFELADLPNPRSRYSRSDSELAARIVGLERRALLGRLRRGGVQVIEWDVSKPFDQTIAVATRQTHPWRTPA